MEHMFDNGSFTEEITNTSEAESCYQYFAKNLTGYRKELTEAGLSYEDVAKQVRQCWINLVQSSKRVGYSNGQLERMAKLYAIPK